MRTPTAMAVVRAAWSSSYGLLGLLEQPQLHHLLSCKVHKQSLTCLSVKDIQSDVRMLLTSAAALSATAAACEEHSDWFEAHCNLCCLRPT